MRCCEFPPVTSTPPLLLVLLVLVLVLQQLVVGNAVWKIGRCVFGVKVHKLTRTVLRGKSSSSWDLQDYGEKKMRSLQCRRRKRKITH